MHESNTDCSPTEATLSSCPFSPDHPLSPPRDRSALPDGSTHVSVVSRCDTSIRNNHDVYYAWGSRQGMDPTDPTAPMVPTMPRPMRADGGARMPPEETESTKTFRNPEADAPMVPDLS